MMMDWSAAYRPYDDDTLTALANVGLLRRAAKDVEAGKVCWATTGDAPDNTLEADGQRIVLDARGPQHAQCDCPAPGMCKHILAAVLWLRNAPAQTHTQTQTQPPAAASGALSTPALEQGAAAPDPLAEILALDSAALFKTAGIAAVRQAAQAQFTALEWRVQGSTLVMDLADLGVTCRWVAGAGFAGMVSELAANQRKAVHLSALAALRLALGQPLTWPAGVAPTVVGTEHSNALAASERAFIEQVQGTLHELLCGGLSHASTLVSARLLALNMSARAEGLPRLAALLRNLGGMVDLLVRHDHQAQERDALALVSQCHALCEALLASATTTGANHTALLPVLRGKLRRTFDTTDALELLPVGAHWWQTLGAARGLTVSLWDIQGQRLLHAMLARTDASDTAFTRQSAWSAQAMWAGAGTVETLCKAPLSLSQPRLADDDRLALGGTARAKSLPVWQADDPRMATLGCGDWAELADRLRNMAGLSGSAGNTELLRPARTRAPRLDEAQQQLHWALQDAQGRWLNLVLPLGPQFEKRAENLDRFAARQAPIHAVLVRLERSHASTHLIPIAALSTDDRGKLQVVSLDFAAEPARKTPLAERILRLMQLRKEQRAPAIAPPTLAERLLLPVLSVLETQAATGRMPLTQAQRMQLDESAQAIASVGLHTVERALRAHAATHSPHTLTRLHQLCLRTLELEGLSGTVHTGEPGTTP